MIPTKELKTLYFQMLRIRRIEEFLAKLNSEKTFPRPVNFSMGREAIAVGLCHSVTSSDLLFKRVPSVAFALAKGVALETLLKSFTANNKSSETIWQDTASGFMGKAITAKNSLPLAIERALTIKQKKEPGIVLNFLDNESNSEDALQEQLSFAATRSLPILFIVENNPYGYSRENQSDSISFIFRRGESLSIPGMHVDGNDVEACATRTSIALERARNGHGPTIIEFRTPQFKLYPTESRDSTQEIHRQLKTCPLLRAEKKLMNEGDLTKTEKEMGLNRIDSEIQRVMNGIEDFPLSISGETWHAILSES